jgi:DNA-directed RNA polymerase subunit RPC12/RpoP
MRKAPYYVPVAIRESTKAKALLFVNEEYIQAHETIECPLCSVKYLFLCDQKDSRRMKSIARKHEEALLYFTDRMRLSHPGGHIEDVLVLPYELHMITSDPLATDVPDGPGRKAG